MQRFTDLKVWQRAHALVVRIHDLIAAFPPEERFAVTSQLWRASVSVPSNIAEGSKRRSNQEYARFLNIAEGSLAEAEYLVMLSRDLKYIAQGTAAEVLGEIDEVSRMLSGLRAKVEHAGRDGS
jgi:four helix bundle protein